MMNAFLLVASQVLMFFIGISSLAGLLAMIIAGLVFGSIMTLITVIAHEDYGGKNIPKILGAFMTAGAVGILIYE